MNQFYQTLLFDADGTLLDFAAAEKKALQQTFALFQLPYSPAIEKAYSDMNSQLWAAYERGEIERDTLIYTRFGKLFSMFAIDEDGICFEDVYQEQLGKQHDLIPHAKEVVAALQPHHDLILVTNGVVETQYQRLAASGLEQYFQHMFVSGEIGYRKPQKEYFQYCFDKLELQDLSSVLIIGDSLSSDMAGGCAAGIDTCWYNPKKQKLTTDIRISYEITDLRELYAIAGKEFQ